MLTVDYANTLSNIMDRGLQSVRKLRTLLEEKTVKYNWDKDVELNETILNDTIYYNAGFINNPIDPNDEDDKYLILKKRLDTTRNGSARCYVTKMTRHDVTCSTIKRDSCFGNGEINLSFKTSDVHVPFNVYNFDKRVINGGDFSRQINDQFDRNFKAANSPVNNMGMTWQYFAASDGYTRYYPALEWQLRDEIQEKF